MPSFGTTEKTQFVQLWMVMYYEFEGFEDLFTKHSKEQLHH